MMLLGGKGDRAILNHEELVVHLAQRHAKDWKRASKTNAEIIYEIITAMTVEGYSHEMSLDIADETLRYIQKSF